jgi:hypothetical protein
MLRAQQCEHAADIDIWLHAIRGQNSFIEHDAEDISLDPGFLRHAPDRRVRTFGVLRRSGLRTLYATGELSDRCEGGPLALSEALIMRFVHR